MALLAVIGSTIPAWGQCSVTSLSYYPYADPQGTGGFPFNYFFNVSGSNCTWTAVTDSPAWIVLTTPSSGIASNSQVTHSYSIGQNSGSAPRRGTITVNTGTSSMSFDVVQNSSNCAVVNVAPANPQVPVGGGAVPLTFTTDPANCWVTRAGPTAAWLNGPASIGPQTQGYPTMTFTAKPNAGVPRSDTIQFGPSNIGPWFPVTINQVGTCSYTLSSAGAAAQAAGGAGTVSVTTQAACNWTAVPNVNWISMISGVSYTGSGPVGYTVQPNTGPQRAGTITIAGQTFTVTQLAGCALSISPSAATQPASGGNGAMNVIVADGCGWGAESTVSWLQVIGALEGSGNGVVSYRALANTGPARTGVITLVDVTFIGTGTITIAGQNFTVSQSGGCTFALSPTSASFDSGSHTATVNIATGPNCAWNPSSNSAWITPLSAGTGPGSLSYQVAANTAGAPRNGEITIGGIVFPVAQAGNGCNPALQPSSVFTPAAGGAATVGLSLSDSSCSWTVSNLPPWLTVSPLNGVGSRQLTLTAQVNTQNTSRSAVITIAGLALSVVQSFADCSSAAITFPASSQSFPSTGGAGAIPVSAPSGCDVTVFTNDSFIRIQPIAPGNGSRVVSFTLTANASNLPRTGTILIAGKPLLITQAGDSSPSVTCSAASTPVPVRSTGRTEPLAEIEILCSGRTGGLAYAADVLLLLDAAVTNRITSGFDTLDAKLVVQSGGEIAGRLEGLNAIRFPDVPFSGEPVISMAFRIRNVKADVSHTGSEQTLNGTVSVIAPLSIPVSNSRLTLGTLRSALSFSRLGLVDGTLPVVFQEGFAGAFKLRDAEANGGSADTATRLMLRLSRLPLGAMVYAPVSSVNNNARLMSADSFGAGGSAVTGSPRNGVAYAPIPVSNGVATATWEVQSASNTQIDGAEFRIIVDNASAVDLANLQTEGFLGPVDPTATAHRTAPIPRFLDVARPPTRVDLRITAQVSTSGSRPVPVRAPVAVGSTATFLYQLRNNSENRADDVVVTTNLVTGFSSAQCAPACRLDGDNVRLELGSLAAGATTSATVTVAVGGVGNCPNCVGNGTTLTNGAGVTSSNSDHDPSNNYSQTDVQVNDVCRFTLGRSLVTLDGAASTFALDVTTGPACDWTAPPSNGVQISPSGALRGSATIQISVPFNATSQPKDYNLSIQGQNLRIVQAAQGCAFLLANAPAMLLATGQDFTVNIQTSANCSWRATTQPDWLRITSSDNGSGNFTLRLNAQSNGLVAPRAGTLFVSGRQIQILQAAQGTSGSACTFSPSATELTAAVTGAQGTITVTTQAGCLWNPSTQQSWISVTRSGTALQYTIAPNSGGPRTGTIIAGGVIQVTQNGSTGPGNSVAGLRFVAMRPCRVMETRFEYNYEGRTGDFGPPHLRGGQPRTLVMANSNVCQIPANARAYVLNVTVVPRNAGVDSVTVWPANESKPDYWTVRSPDAQIVANSAIVKANGGAIQVFSSNDTDLLLDISGYYTDDPAASNQTFYALNPCRVIDTRLDYRAPGPFGPPSMLSGETRRFRFTGQCSIPSNASAYSVTITAVPPSPLQYLTAFPSSTARPNVSSLNSPSGRTLANSMILPAGPDGTVEVFAFDRTDFLIDVTGYFAPDNGIGLYYYPVTQCRANDTRNSAGIQSGSRTVPLMSSSCGIPAAARAYAVNVTALPPGALQYITVWPTGQARPTDTSILNAFQGQIVTNSAIVPAGTNGSIDLFTADPTHVVVELSGYFGR